LQELRIAENQNVGNARVVAAAIVPEEPIPPRRTLFLVTGVLLGSILAIATARILEATDKSIKTVEQAKKLFGFTTLGVIPASKKSEKINLRSRDLERSTPEVIVKDSPRSPLSAAYRMLQANLKSLSSDKKLKVIVVTSSLPKEGKSTVSANLAVAMAQQGHKVLLVDADMHLPLQHRIWELPNQLGLSNILVGQTEFGAAIKKVIDNLDVLTAGVIPANPTALVDSQQMARLISLFSTSYDFTLIDAPALSVDADASILGKMADGVLLVVRLGVVDSTSAALTKEFLLQSGQDVLGQVINGVIAENEPYSYYYFSKGYYAEESATTDKTKAGF
jgi:capsular exopolysaccharide synthesis family protein